MELPLVCLLAAVLISNKGDDTLSYKYYIYIIAVPLSHIQHLIPLAAYPNMLWQLVHDK